MGENDIMHKSFRREGWLGAMEKGGVLNGIGIKETLV